ncbi:MAG TPA: CpsD/CapB family tyrosine-protein kinase [Polyangia bacterium]
MADQPRRPPPGQGPSQRVTGERTAPPPPRATLPMGTSRAKAIAEKILADDETQTSQETGQQQKFLPDELVKTTLTGEAPRRARTTTPMGTVQSEPSPSVILATQQVLTREVPPGMLEKLAAEGAVEVRVGGAPGLSGAPRTQVWVATHKPPEDPDPRLVLVREPDSSRAASFRVLRHRLQERGDPRVIAVTSAGRKEGKTTCAVNLALALGECGRARVLLVEANLRAPSLAPLFGFMPPECFTAQMQRHKEKPLDAWSVVEVFSPYLHVLAVKPDAGGKPLLDGPGFSIAMEMLSQAGYDYIVIDTPPVLGAADVNLIEDSCDGVLFTAWARTTSSRSLRAAIEQLAPAKLLGVTLLDV